MPRCVTTQALLLCQLAAWAALFPAGWFFCHQNCDAPVAVVPGFKPPVVASSHHSAAWSASLVDAIENGARDALGSAAAAEAALAGGLPSGLAAEVRALVAARLRHQDADSSASKSGAAKQSGSDELLKNCPAGRPAVPLSPAKDIQMPVLDGLDGRVKPAGLKLPDMPANSWGIPMPNITVEVSPGKVLTVDEVVYGYDLLFEAMHLFSYVSWGRVPMQQDPTDALTIADLLSRLQPDCFVELGTNTGGGAIFYAEVMKQYQANPLVVTIDVHPPTLNWDRFANKVCPHCVPVTCHPTWYEKGLIEFVQGYTQEDAVVAKVEGHLNARQCKRTVVMHDSDHRGASIERDLQIYHRFVQVGSYLVVQDTKLSRMRGGRYKTMEAVRNFLETPAGKGKFAIDKTFEYLLFSHHHNGFMQRIAK